MKNLARVKKFPLFPPSGSNTPLSAAGHLLGSTRPADIQREILYFFFSGIREPRKKGGQLPQVAHTGGVGKLRGRVAFPPTWSNSARNSREWSLAGSAPTVPKASRDVAPRASLPTR